MAESGDEKASLYFPGIYLSGSKGDCPLWSASLKGRQTELFYRRNCIFSESRDQRFLIESLTWRPLKFPGMEMEALALGALRVLSHEEEAKDGASVLRIRRICLQFDLLDQVKRTDPRRYV